MKSENKERKEESTEDIFMETLRVLNAIKPPNSCKAAKESKESVYKTICERISHYEYSLNPTKAKRRQIFIYTISVASTLAILFIPLSLIIYNRGYNNASSEFTGSYIELNVPKGALSKITLPDCTKVTLNGGSKLTYPALFGKERKVTLSGEAFFDVRINDKKPFLVHTPHLTAKVLGTQFCFKAYEDEKITLLTLEEGSIYATPTNNSQGEGIILKPSQQIIINNDTKEMTRINVNTEEFISWKDGILVFRDKSLEEIRVLLEKQFNTPILITEETLKRERYSAQFKHGENLFQILDKLSYKREWKHITQNGQIQIIRRK